MKAETQDKRLKVAAVGLGWVTTNRHLPSIRENPNYEIIGVIDRHPDRAESIAKKYQYQHFQTTDILENVPWLDQVDAITVGAYPQSHYALIKSALKLGKHVLTEKPFTMTVSEGEEIVALAREKGLILGIVHNFQFASSTRLLLQDLQSGCFGKIKSIVARQLSNPCRRLPVWYEHLPLGLFYDESPHFFYLISRLAPGLLKFLKCDVYPSTMGLVTPAIIDIKYCCNSQEHGTIPVTVNMNFEATLSEWNVTVYGEHYLGNIDIFRDIYIRLPNDGLHTMSTVIQTSALATWQHWSQHFNVGTKYVTGKLRYGNDLVFGRFATSVACKKEPEYIGPDDALNVLRMQHEVIQNQTVLY